MNSHRTTVAVILLGLVIILGYSHTFSYPFIFDDRAHITDSISLRVSSFNFTELARSVADGYATRPVATLTLAINYFFGQLNPTGYRLFNLTIHLVNGILVFFLLRKTCHLAKEECLRNSLAPLFGTLLWFANPIQTQSVTYVIQRMTSLATLFYLAALILFIQAKTSTENKTKFLLYSGCIFTALLAFGSKEIAFTLPIIILLYHFYFLKDSAMSSKTILLPLVLVVCFLIAFFSIIHSTPMQLIERSYAARDFTLIERLLTEPRVILYYLSLFFFPFYKRFNFDHDFPLSTGLIHPPQTLLALITIGGLILLAILLKKKDRILSFALLWFFINLALESSVIGLEIIFEHRVYLPSIFLFFSCILLVERRIANTQLLVILLSCLVLIFTLWTYQRNLVWKSSLSLWQDAALKSPLKARTQGYLGQALYREGDFTKALHYLDKAIALDPADLNAINTITALLSDNGERKKAIKILRNSLSTTPDHPKTRQQNLAWALYKDGQAEEAVQLYRQVLSQAPKAVQAYVDLGEILIKDKPGEAINLFDMAIKIDTNNPKLHKRIGWLYYSNNMFEKALHHYQATLALRYSQPTVHNTLGGIYFKTGDLKAAQKHFQIAVQQNPSYGEAKKNFDIVTRMLTQAKKNTK